MHPVIRNLDSWDPLLRWFWGGGAIHGAVTCRYCGAYLATDWQIGRHIISHETGGAITNNGNGFYGPFQDCTSTAASFGFNPMDPVDTVRGNYRVYVRCGRSPWPYL